MIVPSGACGLKNGECYKNIYKLRLSNPLKFDSGEYRMCLGFTETELLKNILIRHAYIVDKDGAVVYDYLTESGLYDKILYYNIKIIEDEDEYLSIITKDFFGRALAKFMRDEEMMFFRENNINEMFLGQDMVFRNV